MPQFCILFYANYTILATQRRGPWPNGPSPKYAPSPVLPFLRVEGRVVWGADPKITISWCFYYFKDMNIGLNLFEFIEHDEDYYLEKLYGANIWDN